MQPSKKVFIDEEESIMFTGKTYKRIALIDGKQVEYDTCSPRQTTLEGRTFIGTGTIYSIDGIMQTSSGPILDEYNFFIRNGDNND